MKRPEDEAGGVKRKKMVNGCGMVVEPVAVLLLLPWIWIGKMLSSFYPMSLVFQKMW